MNQNQNNQLMSDLMIHSTHMEQICRLIILADTSRFGMNLHDVAPGDVKVEKTYEHWGFGFEELMGETLQIQAVTCLCCGNYMLSSKGSCIHNNAYCNCPFVYEGDETVKNRKIKKKMGFDLMNDYDAFDEFIGMVLPEGAADRLCEDVIGEISRFLV